MRIRRTLLVVLAGSLLAAAVSTSGLGFQQSAPPAVARTQNSTDLSFAELVRNLSEPNGYFDTDNLISNEKSYLQVIPELEQRAVAGGAQALGIKSGLDVGCTADIMALDADHAALACRSGDSLLDSYVFAGSGGIIADVWRGGRKLAFPSGTTPLPSRAETGSGTANAPGPSEPGEPGEPEATAG